MGWVLLVVLAGAALVVGLLAHRDTPTDPSGVVGLLGVAHNTFSREGVVFVRGELWRATSTRGIVQKGDTVKIIEVRPGLLVVVERVASLENS